MSTNVMARTVSVFLKRIVFQDSKIWAFVLGLISAGLIYSINYDETPSVLMNVSIALITILISVAIFLFTPNINSDALDKWVILDQVIKPKKFLTSVFFVFIPILFWKKENYFFDNFLFLVSCTGIYGLVAMLQRAYSWTRTYDEDEKDNTKFTYRVNYLEKINNPREISIFFGELVWNNSHEPNFELEIIDIFKSKIVYLANSKQLKFARISLESFANNISKRRLFHRIIYKKF